MPRDPSLSRQRGLVVCAEPREYGTYDVRRAPIALHRDSLSLGSTDLRDSNLDIVPDSGGKGKTKGPLLFSLARAGVEDKECTAEGAGRTVDVAWLAPVVSANRRSDHRGLRWESHLPHFSPRTARLIQKREERKEKRGRERVG